MELSRDKISLYVTSLPFSLITEYCVEVELRCSMNNWAKSEVIESELFYNMPASESTTSVKRKHCFFTCAHRVDFSNWNNS